MGNVARLMTSSMSSYEVTFWGITFSPRQIVAPMRRIVQYVTDWAVEAYSICMLLRLHIPSTDDYHPAIEFRWTNCNGSFLVHRQDEQITIVGYISPGKVIDVPIVICVSIFLIFVTEVLNRIIRLYMCPAHMRHCKVLNSQLGWLTIILHDTIVMQLIYKLECALWIIGNMHEDNLTQSCHTTHTMRSQCITRICINDHHHVALLQSFTCITLRSDLMHMVQTMKIAYGRSWILRRSNWTRTSENVQL